MATPVLGVTVDGYAVEGGYDAEGCPATSFGLAQAVGRIRPSVRARLVFDHLGDVVRRCADLGFGEVRITLEWARLEPRHDDHDLAALKAYVDAIDVAAGCGLRVVALLMDAAWPSWLGQEPWLSSWAPPRFAEHAGWLAAQLEGRVRAIATMRAPTLVARHGWLDATAPPYRRRARPDAHSALDGLLVAHQLAVEAIVVGAPSAACALVMEADGDVEPRLRALTQGQATPSAPWPRSNGRWRSTPPFAWWLSGRRDALEAATSASGPVDVLEVRPDATGFLPLLEQAAGLGSVCDAVHVRGALPSTGPLPEPAGLLGVHQHGGHLELSDPEARVRELLARPR